MTARKLECLPCIPWKRSSSIQPCQLLIAVPKSVDTFPTDVVPMLAMRSWLEWGGGWAWELSILNDSGKIIRFWCWRLYAQCPKTWPFITALWYCQQMHRTFCTITKSKKSFTGCELWRYVTAGLLPCFFRNFIFSAILVLFLNQTDAWDTGCAPESVENFDHTAPSNWDSISSAEDW